MPHTMGINPHMVPNVTNHLTNRCTVRYNGGMDTLPDDPKPQIKRRTIVCPNCSQSFSTRKSYQRFCSQSCQAAYWKEKNSFDSIGRESGLPTATVGTIGELAVALDLLRRGYHVFRALSPSCPADLVAYRDGDPLKIEVRTGYLRNGKLYAVRKLNGNIDHLAISTTAGLFYEPELVT